MVRLINFTCSSCGKKEQFEDPGIMPNDGFALPMHGLYARGGAATDKCNIFGEW